MNSYDAYYHEAFGYEFVKAGWSWPAFFFVWIWAITKKLYLAAGSVVICSFIIGVIMTSTTYPSLRGDLEGLSFIGALALMCVFGAAGNGWRVDLLKSANYKFIITVKALSPEGASLAYTDWANKQNLKPVEHEQKAGDVKDRGMVGDAIARLERLGQLKEKGMLTDEEFQEQKRKLLKSVP